MLKPKTFLILVTSVLAILMSGCCRSRLSAPCSTTSQNSNPILHVKPKKSVLKVSGGSHLDGLHPQLIKKARVLYELAEAEGIQIKFISGFRRFRKKRSRKPGRSVASWHNFGAAFDINLLRRKSMRDALKHLSDDQADWDKLGSLAKSLGLTWGKPWGEQEIFHFEWHPGHPDALRQKAFDRLTKVTGTNVEDYQKAWKLFKVED